jgi:hypothetical protein
MFRCFLPATPKAEKHERNDAGKRDHTANRPSCYGTNISFLRLDGIQFWFC